MTKEFFDLKHFGTKNRMNYLQNTDWMQLRFTETTEDYDQSIKDKRAQARAEIALLRECIDPIEDWDTIKHLTIDFQ